MHRPIIYDQAQNRDYDVLHGWAEALYSGGQLALDLLGSGGTVIAGLGATAPGALTINLAAGDIYSLAAVDTSAYGSIAADATQTMQQGYALAQSVTLSTTGISSGQSRYTLIQATFSQTDDIPSDDPNGGILNYLNATNPSGPPWSGPSNSGAAQNTRRKGVCVISTVNGAPATTGSEVPPNPSGGNVPLYLVDLAFGQSVITLAEILVAGPSVGVGVPSNYPEAPFFAGLAQKSTVAVFAGNPNGNVAGTMFGTVGTTAAPNEVWDTVHSLLWICSKSGSTTTAVWINPSGFTPLTAATTVFVSTAGSDTTGTGTSTNPWATIQKAANYFANSINLNGQVGTISIAAGTYSAGASINSSILGSTGQTSLVFTTSGAVTINGSGFCFLASGGAQFTVNGNFTLNTTNAAASPNAALVANNGGRLAIAGSGLTFGTTQTAHIIASAGGQVNNSGGLGAYTIAGGGPVHWSAQTQGEIVIQGATITLSSTPAFSSVFAQAFDTGVIECGALIFAGTGATGSRYSVTNNAVINTSGGGTTYLPGNSVGSGTNSGTSPYGLYV
jgi:hypothetical protein